MKRSAFTLLAALVTFSMGAHADPDRGESGKGWKEQKEQAKEVDIIIIPIRGPF